MTQHYRVSLNAAIAHYQNGDLTAKGLLHFYLKIRLKDGWILKESPKEIYTKLGISRAAFYNALSRLKAEGSIDWSVPDNTIFSIKLAVCECGQPSAIVDELSAIVDEPSVIVDELSAIVENQPPKPPSSEALGVSSNSSQISSNFLSEEREREIDVCLNKIPEVDREKFLQFARSKAVALPNPPQLIEKWIASNIDWIKQEFDKAYPKEAPTAVKDTCSAAAQSDKFFEQLHPEIEEGLKTGEISRLDLPYKGLFDSFGNWWKIDDWIERDESPTTQAAAQMAIAALRQRFSTVRPGG